MLIYPVTDRRMITESMKKYTDMPVWDAESLEHFPNVYMEVAEFDCLRDEEIAFAERLRAEGVFTELYEVKGACHGYEAVLESRIVEKAMRRRIQWIQSVLNK